MIALVLELTASFVIAASVITALGTTWGD